MDRLPVELTVWSERIGRQLYSAPTLGPGLKLDVWSKDPGLRTDHLWRSDNPSTSFTSFPNAPLPRAA